MKTVLTTIFWVSGLTGLFAQTVLLKNGTEVPFDSIERTDAATLTANITTADGLPNTTAIYVSDVQEFQIPPPPALSNAADLLAKGKYPDALAQIEPLFAHEKSIRDLSGNWWAKTAVMELSIFFALHRTEAAQALAQEILGFTTDPEIVSATKLQLTLHTNYKTPDEAVTAYDQVINQSADARTLSQAWIGEGNAYFQDHKFEDSLLAYLTVIAFYPENNPLLPEALWGSGRAYLRLKDTDRATKTFAKIVSTYPDSPQATLASQEIETLQQEK